MNTKKNKKRPDSSYGSVQLYPLLWPFYSSLMYTIARFAFFVCLLLVPRRTNLSNDANVVTQILKHPHSNCMNQLHLAKLGGKQRLCMLAHTP